MTSERFPNRDRALRHLRYAQAVYRYGRFPRRYVLGFDQPPETVGSRVDSSPSKVSADALARP